MFENPFRPGAGHQPPHLAGRAKETDEFRKLLTQTVILENMVLTGLRGVGKTVLLDTFKPIAIQEGWRWASTYLSESATISEASLSLRIITDLAVITSDISISSAESRKIGFVAAKQSSTQRLDYSVLRFLYDNTPGLAGDKLKAVLEYVWENIKRTGKDKGVILAYDEAQNLSDQAAKDQYPLSLLLDVFQSIQTKGIPFMLVLTGLPMLFPKLVEARTFAERMFRVVTLTRLDAVASKDAIEKPIADRKSTVCFSGQSVDTIVKLSGGYPYFIQFICREAFDTFAQQMGEGRETGYVPVAEILRKLDTDFFAGRWNRATDRQRELMEIISELDHCDEEFSVQEIVDRSKVRGIGKEFNASNAGQMLGKLVDAGLVYKNRYGKYSFAVPLLGEYIRRLKAEEIQ